MVGIEEEVQLILVTTIGGEYRTVEVRYTLVTEIASGIGIIEVKAYVEALAGCDIFWIRFPKPPLTLT